MPIKQLSTRRARNESESPIKSGFSDVRLRLFVLLYTTLILLLALSFGIIWTFLSVSMLTVFIAIKIYDFQKGNQKSIYLHLQAMDKMYHNGLNAKRYAAILRSYDKPQPRRQAAVLAEPSHPKGSLRLIRSY